MNDSKLIKARLKFENACGKVEAKLQKRISFGEVSVDYYPGDGICAEVNAKVVPLREIPARGKLDEEWWDKHAILGVKMSKLKVHKIGDLCFDFKMGKDVGIDFYLKSNVDTVIEEKDRAIEFAKALTLKDIEIIKEKDKEIAELKEQLESEKASRYADSVDAGMENRRLTRALWLARAERAKDRAKMCDDFAYLGDTERNISMTLARTWMKCRMLIPSEWSKVWKKVERKCRAMADKF